MWHLEGATLPPAGSGSDSETKSDATERQASLRKALADDRERLGGDDPQVAARLLALADLLREADRLDEAKEAAEEALRILRVAHDGPHADTAAALVALGRVRSAKGEYRDAVALFREAVQVRRECLGDDHADTIGAVEDLFLNLKPIGFVGDAERTLVDHLNRLEALPDPNPDHQMVLLRRLLWFYEVEIVREDLLEGKAPASPTERTR